MRRVPSSAAPRAPARQRANGEVALAVERAGTESVLRRVRETGSARVRFPTTRDGVPEAVLINTGGGIAGGDAFRTRLVLGPGAQLVATSAAAEKAYRSDGATARVSTGAELGPGARLEWLPQELILFDRARIARSLTVDLRGDASALLFEATVFGRGARDERVADGLFEDRWRVFRDGRLLHADALRLRGDLSARLQAPLVASGMRAFATALHVGPDAEARLDAARDALAGSVSACGASAWDGRLAVRWLAPAIGPLREDVARFMRAFRGREMPRVWST